MSIRTTLDPTGLVELFSELGEAFLQSQVFHKISPHGAVTPPLPGDVLSLSVL